MSRQGLAMASSHNEYHQSIAAFPGREAVAKGLDSTVYKKAASAQKVFRWASEYCAKDLASICYGAEKNEGPWMTVGLVTHCYGIYRTLEEWRGRPKAFAGYSQGEFTACAAAGVFEFPEILGLILGLEQILEEESPADEAMIRVMDLDQKVLQECCQQYQESGKQVYISAYLSDTQNIISGKQPDLQELVQELKKRGARWTLPLPVKRGYHSPLCQASAEKARKFFLRMQMYSPSNPVYSCYDGQRSADPYTIRDKLSRQVQHPIHWKTLADNCVSDGIRSLIEIGPGCTVSGNTRIANPNIACQWVKTMNEVRCCDAV